MQCLLLQEMVSSAKPWRLFASGRTRKTDKTFFQLKLSVRAPLQVGWGERVPKRPGASSVEVVQGAPERRDALDEDFQPEHQAVSVWSDF